ncbi:sugar-binding transcriptional regulator [Leucobacter tenebrionis]|uniref:sugar-binding transcriptional regulator n=1 Tax=Leucobacter tenebrionis TaxID=2873270 RepID=UPI001CA6C11A|nr:sugar-binding domain-containing protein [Leucobacter tenebrionis]QZY52957.1 hypothetical protein KVY00_05850 [Leucobacter tenebrionis]
MPKRSPTEAVSAADRALAARVARLFYLDDRSKVQISESLGVSRFKVARLLDLALNEGIVTISIDDGGMLDEALSERAGEVLGLERVTAVSAFGTLDEVRGTVGREAARLLSTTLRDGETLGMGWGRALGSTAEAIESLPQVSVVQMTGATEMTRHLSPVEVVRRIGNHSGGDMLPLFAPLVADDEETAEVFRRQSDIARVLDHHRDVTTAVMAVGSWNPPSSQLYNSLSPEARQELLAQGAVAEIGVTLLDRDGGEVASDFAKRCIAVTTERLRAIPRVIAVAAGTEKATAVVALARSRLISELVVDAELAEAAIAVAEQTGSNA